MALTMCDKGHYYDDSKYSRCPFCGISLSHPVAALNNKVRPRDTDEITKQGRAIGDEVTISAAMASAGDDEKTIGYFNAAFSGDLVVGWLVCTKGKEMGRDYRLHAERNFVGRSAKMDVSIFDDGGISRENHMSIIYDPRDNEFYAMIGESAASVNDQPLSNGQKLEDGDTIEIGASEFTIVKYCVGERKWEK